MKTAGLFASFLVLLVGCGDFDRAVKCGRGTVQVGDTCQLSEKALAQEGKSSAPNSATKATEAKTHNAVVEEDAGVTPVSHIGTQEVDELECGEGTHEFNNECVPDAVDPWDISEPTVKEVPVANCGKGTYEDGGVCVADQVPDTETETDAGTQEECAGRVDEGCPCELNTHTDCYDGPAGTVWKGICSAGIRICENGRWGACLGEITAHSEDTAEHRCNGSDDDCDGEIDEECPSDFDGCSVPRVPIYVDRDGDGYGIDEVGATSFFCPMGDQPMPPSYVVILGDCDDDDADVSPNGTEVCEDGFDNDCDGAADEECSEEAQWSFNVELIPTSLTVLPRMVDANVMDFRMMWAGPSESVGIGSISIGIQTTCDGVFTAAVLRHEDVGYKNTEVSAWGEEPYIGLPTLVWEGFSPVIVAKKEEWVNFSVLLDTTQCQTGDTIQANLLLTSGCTDTSLGNHCFTQHKTVSGSTYVIH